MAARRRHSKVSKLPSELQDAIHDAIVKRGATYDDLVVLVNQWVSEGRIAADDAPSRAGLARYGQHFAARMDQVSAARQMAKQVIAGAEEYGMALDEAATNMVLNEIMAIFMSRDPSEPMEPNDIARIAAGLGKLQSSSSQREKMKSEFVKRAQTAVKKASGAMKRAGASKEAIEEVEKLLLGL